MKKIRTAQGGILFLEDEDYMPKLLAYLRETAGNDAADLVEEWAREQTAEMAEALLHVSNKARDAEERERIAELKTLRILDKLNDEREEHTEEISELEEELTRVAGLKDEAVAFNRALVDLVENPEKIFPEIGSKVFRFVDKELPKTEHGRIDAYKLRMDSRTKRPEFFVRISWNRAWGNGIALPCALYVMEGIANEH